MKKIFSLMIIIICILSLFGCLTSEKDDSNSDFNFEEPISSIIDQNTDLVEGDVFSDDNQNVVLVVNACDYFDLSLAQRYLTSPSYFEYSQQSSLGPLPTCAYLEDLNPSTGALFVIYGNNLTKIELDDLINVVLSDSSVIEPINEVGEKAFWYNDGTNEALYFVKSGMFAVVQLSSDGSISDYKEKTIALAKEIIEKI